MAGNKGKDMTEGKPVTLILGFALPLLFGLFFQQLYSVVDTIIVGRYLGVDALAGVGATGPLNFMINGYCIGMCAGFSIPVSHKFGAKDYSGMRGVIANATWLCTFFSVVLTIAVAIVLRSVLVLMHTPEEIFEYSYAYIHIIFLGIPALILYNILSSIIRAIGDSKTPLYFLLISSVMNIALDLFMIIVLKLGIAGAAYATIISQLISGLLCLLYMIKKFEILRVHGEEWKYNPSYCKTLLSMGVPMGLQYSITAIGSVILQSSVNTLGPLAVACVTAGGKINIFLMCPLDALGTTMATYAGQNIGAKKLERLTPGLLSAIGLSAIYVVFAWLLIFFKADSAAKLFVDNPSPEMLAMTRQFLIVAVTFFFFLALVNIVRFMIQGMGFSTLAILAGVFEMFARGIAGIWIVPAFGFTGACFASPLAWFAADCFLIPAYIYVKHKLEKKFSN